tara:strand:+ start:192 stop:407 length:216 start_codon:yes stop_codon:yes gene_type:complete
MINAEIKIEPIKKPNGIDLKSWSVNKSDLKKMNNAKKTKNCNISKKLNPVSRFVIDEIITTKKIIKKKNIL